MLRSSSRKTQLPRVCCAVLFAFAFPPFVLTLVGVASDGWLLLTQAPGMFWAALTVSLMFGWPFVLVGGVIWRVLERFGRHYAWCAALVGVTAGGALGAFISSLGDEGSGDATTVLMTSAVGAATGLGVWLIAYAFPGEPKPIITRPPLNL